MNDLPADLSVLLVDPCSEDADRITGFLRRIPEYNYSIVRANSKEEALKSIEDPLPDLILLEHDLEEGTGLSLAREIRGNHFDIPIILITDDGDEVTCAKYFRIGVDDYRVKSELDPDVLHTAMKSAMTQRRNIVEQERAAKFDDLTELFNRRFTFTRIHEEMRSAARHDNSFSLCLIDLDHFKTINDRHGHLAGDRLLKRVSQLIKESIRTGDIAGRYGGDEFLLGLRNTDNNGAFRAAHKLVREISNAVFDVSEGVQTRVTCCIGVAEFDGTDYRLDDEIESVEAFVDRADKALYHAKKEGSGPVERRRFERHELDDPVLIKFEYEGERSSGLMVDFSRRGARLKEAELIPEGEQITLLFHTDNGTRVERPGIIRYCRKGERISRAMLGVEVDLPMKLIDEMIGLTEK